MSEVCPQPDSWTTSDVNNLKTSHKWTINKFSECTEKPGEHLDSDLFWADEDIKTKWRLRFYPKGVTEEHKDYVAIYLFLEESDAEEVTAKYKMAIIDAKNQIYRQLVPKDCFEPFKRRLCGFGSSKLITRESLKTPENQLLPNDCLTIYCEVTTQTPRKTTSGRKNGPKRMKTLTNDMIAIYKDLVECDVDIIVSGQTLKAHKFILRANSPVFKAMFEPNTKESQQNQVIIEDINKEVFAKVLRFLYSDTVVNEDIDSNIELLSAAEKYDFKGLKSICEQNIGSQLNVDNVFDVLTIADKHSAEELKTRAIEFIKNNY